MAHGLASVADTVVTHPNVMNGAALYLPRPDKILYTEGYSLDAFAGGRWGLSGLGQGGGHRIGLVLDKAMEQDMRLRHLQVTTGFTHRGGEGEGWLMCLSCYCGVGGGGSPCDVRH